MLSGCVTVPVVELRPGAEMVKVGKSDAAENSEMLGAVTIADGEGCGGFGFQGSYGRAIVLLQNVAHARGANFAQIMTITEPHSARDCFDNQYVISATLYKSNSSVATSKTPPNSAHSNGARLRELKKLFDDKVITEIELGMSAG